MLSKRTNILFSPEQWGKLQNLTKKTNTSIGELVRRAVDQMYLSEEELQQRRKAVEHILAHRVTLKGKVDYKALINEGRKY